MRNAPELTRQQLRQLKAELVGERARLERSLGLEAERDLTMANEGPAVDMLVATGGVLTQTRARHDAIADALNRLAAGSYGTCAGCKSPIPYGRLIVMPEALTCVACGPRA